MKINLRFFSHPFNANFSLVDTILVKRLLLSYLNFLILMTWHFLIENQYSVLSSNMAELDYPEVLVKQNLTLSCDKCLNYTSTKSWRGYIFTSVCLSVCQCVCVCVSVNKIPAERMYQFGCGFR